MSGVYQIPKNSKRADTSQVGNRVPPNSVEAEISVLGAMMLSKEAISKAAALLNEDSFYQLRLRVVFTAMIRMSEKDIKVDLITLCDELSKQGNLKEIGGRTFVAKIQKHVSTAANVERYCYIVLEMQLRRELIISSGVAINDAYDLEVDILELLDKTEAEIFEIAEKRMSKNFQSMPELTRSTAIAIGNIQQRAKDGVTGLSTGLVDLDKYLGGLQDSELIIIAARPSMGKTALGLTISRNIAKSGKSVAFFSLEMASEQLIIRLLSSEAKINQQKIRTGRITNDENQRLISTLGEMNDMKLFIDDSSLMDIGELKAKCRRLKAEHNIDAVFVDYLQLVRANGLESREREIALISMTLKQIAKDLKIPVVALAQLNRSIESRPGKSRSPMLSDLRESGSIEQDADVIMFVQRREVYGLIEYEDKTPTDGTAELIIGKQRNGPIGTVRTAFNKNYAQFENLNFGYEEMPNQGDF